MSFGSSTKTHTEETRVSTLQISTSAYGVGKARVWGKQRVSGNLLWYGDFRAIPHTTKSTSSGGKGGGGVESTNTSYTYTAGVVVGLCVGTIAGVGQVWSDKDLTSLDALGLTLKTGALRQAPWAHLVANHPDQAVTYSGLAYVANAALDLDSSASMPNLSFEVFGERIIPGGDDAYPADVVEDVLTDAVEGVGLGDVLADTADYRLWCREKSLTVAVAAKDQTSARELIQQITEATLSEVIRSQGKIKFVPYGDEPVGSWAPITSPDYDIGEGDLLSPPRHARKQASDATNRVTLNYSSRAKEYNTVSITREDLSAVTQFGARPETIDLPCITRDAQAAIVCEFRRDRNLYIRNTWEIDVDERFILVEAMDLLTLTFGPQGLDHVPVRVKEVADDGSGTITLLVEEWPFGLLTATLVPTQTVSGYVPEYSVAPGATNAPVILEAPNYLTAPNLELWIGASGGQHWGGAYVWVSDDNFSYQQIGVITNPARYGELTSLLAAGDDPDTTHTAYVNMALSGGHLLSGTEADADSGNTLCWLDGEMIAYATATLVAENKYALTYLRRGMYGTASATHATHAQLLRIDSAVFKYAVPRERIGLPVWIKLQAFNKYGRSPEPLDTVTAYMHTFSGNKPLPLAALSAAGGLFCVELSWALAPNQVGIDSVELWCSYTNSINTAWNLTTQKRATTTWKHTGLEPGTTHYYWGRVIDTSGNASDFYPTGSGIPGTPSSDATSLLEQLEGALGMPQLAAELAEPIALIPNLATAIQIETTTREEADEALAQQITTAQATLSKVSLGLPLEQWVLHGQAIVTVADGKVGTTALRLSGLAGGFPNQGNFVPIDPTKVYKTRFWARPMSTTAGLLYFSLRQFLDVVGTQPGPINGGRSPYKPSGISRDDHNSIYGTDAWGEYVFTWSAVDWQAGVKYVQPEFLDNYSGQAGHWDIQDFTFTEVTDLAQVQETVSATASAVDGVRAEWGVQVQAVADGHRVVSGIKLLSDADGESVFAVLADKLLVYKPDGSGAPKQIVVLGTVNGVVALGLDGNLIVDGSIITRMLGAKQVTADKINGESLEVVDGKFSGQVNVGAFTGWNWPAAGQGGVHLSAAGILAGNYNGGGKFFQLVSGDGTGGNASIYTNIPAYLEDLQVGTLKIADDAVTVPVAAAGAGSATTAAINVGSSGKVCIIATAACIKYTNTSTMIIKRNGSQIGPTFVIQLSLLDSETGAYAGTRTVEIIDTPGGSAYYSVEVDSSADPVTGILALGRKK